MNFRFSKYAWVLIPLIPLFVAYDNDPRVWEQEPTVQVTLPPAEVDWARFYAERFDIDGDLALVIMLVADRVGLSREVAFNLVKVESSFKANAVSSAGAVGLTQVLPSTAAIYGVSRNDLFDREVSLYVGFSYLSYLYNLFDDMPTALAAYNSGPTRVGRLLSRGHSIPTQYASLVLGD